MPGVFPAQWADDLEGGERARVLRWRYDAARRAGLSSLEASLFADGDGDLEQLRQACAAGATAEQLADIFT